MTSKEKAIFAADILDKRKGYDIDVVDIAQRSSFADYFVIATAGSERQTNALKDDIDYEFAQKEIFPKNVEGKKGAGWILMDYGDVIINIFTEEMREKYSLEEVWADCDFIDIEPEEN